MTNKVMRVTEFEGNGSTIGFFVKGVLPEDEIMLQVDHEYGEDHNFEVTSVNTHYWRFVPTPAGGSILYASKPGKGAFLGTYVEVEQTLSTTNLHLKRVQ